MLDQIQVSTLRLFKENRRIAILKELGLRITINIIKNITNHYLITDYNIIGFIKNINRDNQVYILRLIKKNRRIGVLKEFNLKIKNYVVKNLINY